MEHKKNWFINALLNFGIYKKGNRHLYELTLQELEAQYVKVKSFMYNQEPLSQ
ncbi:Fur-regulated basic protein FbpA [Priestia sp. J2]|uniref:Fur-regulated basic protein FbpA n=1 Tax=Priestia sp. J2 TaxID=2886505 RepID=UPI001E3A9FC3|nr:Fur-regulated basic protein FbpA [Priestia sp. J2]